MKTPITNPHALPAANEPFGHTLRRYWSLDPSIHFLNHGSFGATPRFVQAVQVHWRDAMEHQPVRFMQDELPDALRAAAVRLAAFVGATPSRLAFVENATAGANAVMHSMPWRAGDKIVIANHAYPALKNCARYHAARHGLTVVEANVPWPLANAQALINAYAAAIEGGARLVIIDHIFSPLAVTTPVGPIVALCKQRGIQVLVDSAHAPALLPLSLDALGDSGADWIVGNCHKWLCAPKGCGFIVATEQGRHDLHPPVISNYFGQGYEKEFAWTGTGDFTARLSIPAALDFIEALGVARYRHGLTTLARDAAAMLSAAWNVTPGAPAEMFTSMVTLPLPISEAGTLEGVQRWRAKLLAEHNVEVPIHLINDRLWVRISAQVYNEMSDYEALAKAF